jgi:hypothetical protein
LAFLRLVNKCVKQTDLRLEIGLLMTVSGKVGDLIFGAAA